MNQTKPTTHQGNLANLPSSPLRLLIERDQWCIWRWTQKKDGTWQKPPFMALDPSRHASTSDPTTWCSYEVALATVQAGKGDGISYVLTANDPFTAFDLDHCRNSRTHSIDVWAQLFLGRTRDSYGEVTPSGEGIRVWGLTADDTKPVNRKFTLNIEGKPVAAEIFRRAPKILTVSGYRVDTTKMLTNVDKAVDWALVWGERRKAAELEAAAATQSNGHEFNAAGGTGHDIEYIDKMVREGPQGGNRSDSFHVVVGHYLGCDWTIDQIYQHIQQFPGGIGNKYIAEGRLKSEIERSARKYGERELPLSGGWTAPEMPSEMPSPPLAGEPDDHLDDHELDDLDLDGDEDAVSKVDEPKPEPAPKSKPAPDPDPIEEDDPPELDDDLDEDDDPPELEDEPKPSLKLPKLYRHGDPDPRPMVSWLIKDVVPEVGHGLLLGQWGMGKTFMVFEMMASAATGQAFLGHLIKRQCGALLIAAEGASQARLRLDMVVREKCGGEARIPICWYETTPMLLQKGATETLMAMAKQAHNSLMEEFGVPLGLIFIDTISACAGYTQAGGEYDSATGQAVMGVLKAISLALSCFVFGVHHFGKDQDAGARGTIAFEDASDVILACLGERTLSGTIKNTRLALRKNKAGQQGEVHPFTLRLVEAPEPDDDGQPITSMVVDWKAAAGTPNAAGPAPDPWATARRQDQRTAALRLKKVLMSALAEQGADQEINGTTVRAVDQVTIRALFFQQTPADGSPAEKAKARRQQFKRALDWAETEKLIASYEINDVVYLYLCRHHQPDDEAEK